MGPPINSIDSVTRTCWSRDVDAVTWDSLTRQAAAAAKARSNALEEEVTASLLGLLSQTASSLPATLVAYLHQSLRSTPQSRSLARPGFLARQAALYDAIPPKVLSAVCGAVNDSLAGAGEGAFFIAKDVEQLLKGITSISNAIRHSLDSASILYLTRLLNRPPFPLAFKDVSEDIVREYKESTSALLSALSTANVPRSAAGAVVELRAQLGDSVRTFDSAPQPRIAPTKDLSETISYADPDVNILISDLLYRAATPVGISNTMFSVARLAALIKYRLVEGPLRGSSGESALSSVFLELLLAATEELRTTEAKEDVVHQSFVYSRLPEVLRALFEKSGIAEDVPDGLQGGLATALRRFKAVTQLGLDEMAIDNPSTLFDFSTLLISLAGQELISADVGASLADGIHPDDLHPQQTQDYYERFVGEGDTEAMKEILDGMLVDFRNQRSIISGLHMAIESWAQNSDLAALSSVCDVLLEKPRFLQVVFLHIEPKIILAPLRDFLETFDPSASSFSDGSPIETYGRLVLFLESTLSRFRLYSDLTYHLGTDKGFFAKWLPSASAVYALSALDEESKTVVRGWIGGLFGYGLSDDLVSSTNPRALLHVAPTICKQAVAACQTGVVGLEQLKEGLSYFLQPLLSFTLPGVIHWLVGEIGRSLPSPGQTTLYEVLQVFVATKDDPLPRAVLDLVGDDLVDLLDSLPATPASSLSRDTLTAVVKRYDPKFGGKLTTPSSKSWQELLVDGVKDGISFPATMPKGISAALHGAIHNSTIGEIALRLILTALSTLSPSPLASEDEARRKWRLRRCIGSLLADPSSNGKTTPLLFAATEQLLERLLIQYTRTNPNRGDVEAFGEIVATSLVLACEEERESKDPSTLNKTLARSTALMRSVVGVTSSLKKKSNAEETALLDTFSACLVDLHLAT